MSVIHDVERLRNVKTFPQLVKYLRDELEWPIGTDNFEDIAFEWNAKELGIDPATAAKIEEIKQLRPLSSAQPWGIFFVKFEPKRLPVVVLRRILSKLVVRKRARGDQASWKLSDLLFISNYGEGDARQITFAQFTQPNEKDLPTLKVLGWDEDDTVLHIDHTHKLLKDKLAWREEYKKDPKGWRSKWSEAFVLRHREVIETSKELAIRLAELARRIRMRASQVLKIETEEGPLRQLHKAFQKDLIHDLKPEGFADMYAQTIAYGLLAARMSRQDGLVADHISEMVPVTNPFLKELLETFLNVGGRKANIDFDELGIQEVVDLLNDPKTKIDAILRDFGNQTSQEDPVTHFYELFLQEYDSALRTRRGVYYTPKPVVSYIVRSVHELLQTEFGLEDGLASMVTWGEMTKKHKDVKIPEGINPDTAFVQILDPATGTGSFLVEVINVIHKQLIEKWTKAGQGEKKQLDLWNEYVPKHLLTRLYGYELMMAPYTVAHMKIGLKLLETGYRFGVGERLRVYLTNALEPSTDKYIGSDWFYALAHEAQAVNDIKRQHFTVIIGNPPYSKISSNLAPEIRATVERYRHVDGEKIKERGALQFEINLQDDYVKFFRQCEERIKASTVGILGLITNNGFITTPTLRGMRDSLLETFSTIWVVDLHGHLAKGELGPEGIKEENVFDILQGVAMFLGSRTLPKIDDAAVFHTDLYGSRLQKYEFLQSSSGASTTFVQILPSAPFYLFIPHDADLAQEWKRCIGLPELFPMNSAGIITARDGLVIAEDRHELAERLERFSKARGDKSSIYEEFGFSESKRFDLREEQSKLRKLKSFNEPIRRMLHRPFDERFIFFHPSVVWSRSRPMADQMLGGDNVALVATRQVTRPQFEHVFVSRHIIEIKSCSHDRNTQIFPLFIHQSDDELALFSNPAANLNQSFLIKLACELGLKLKNATREFGREDELTPQSVFDYAYAILYSPGYRERYFEFLRSDFPRLPFTSNLKLFRIIAKLGGEMVALHLMESPRLNKSIAKWSDKSPSCEVEKIAYSDHTVWINKDQSQGFVGVSEEVFNFHIGGYQVCEKWLKDRKGRKLSKGDIEHYQKIVVALHETIRLMAEIDKVIDAHGGWPKAFEVK